MTYAQFKLPNPTDSTRDLWTRAVGHRHGGIMTRRGDGPRRLREHDNDDATCQNRSVASVGAM